MRTIDAHSGPVLSLAYLPGQRLASSGWDKTVAVWDLVTGAELARQAIEFPGLWVAGSPEGNRLAVGANVSLDLWNLETMRPPERLASSGGPLAWSRGGYNLVAGWNIWSIAHRSRHTLSGPGTVLAATFHQDGRLFLLSENSLYLARPPAWRLTRQSLATQNVRAGAIHPQGLCLALGCDSGQVHIQTITGETVRTLNGHTARVFGCAFSEDGRLLLTACLDGVVRLWDTTDWRERNCFDWQVSTIRGLAIAPDGMTAAVAGFDGTLLVWDLE